MSSAIICLSLAGCGCAINALFELWGFPPVKFCSWFQFKNIAPFIQKWGSYIRSGCRRIESIESIESVDTTNACFTHSHSPPATHLLSGVRIEEF
jgi:hypothetical protein